MSKPAEKYECPNCKGEWNESEVPDEMIEHEGCPDCLSYCERCGMIKQFEHCL